MYSNAYTQFSIHGERDKDIWDQRWYLQQILSSYFSSFSLHLYFSQITSSNLDSESCNTLTLRTTFHIGPVDQYMNYSGCIAREFIPVVLPCWLSAVWRSSVGNYSPCVRSSRPCTVSEAGTLGTYKWRQVFVVCGLILSSASHLVLCPWGWGLLLLLLVVEGCILYASNRCWLANEGGI